MVAEGAICLLRQARMRNDLMIDSASFVAHKNNPVRDTLEAALQKEGTEFVEHFYCRLRVEKKYHYFSPSALSPFL